MISKRECFCAEQQISVEAVVEEIPKPFGKDAEASYNFLRCNYSSNCGKSTFCRFVNPLTMRNPLAINRISAAG